MKNILVISSDITGHGHKSITEALNERFSAFEDVNVHVVDGFSLGGPILLKIGKMYGPLTRKSEIIWKYVWNVSSATSLIGNAIIQRSVEMNFLHLVNKIKPNLIMTVHPNFNGSLLNILKKYQINTPFVTLIADLVNISSFWVDVRADYVISPTKEAEAFCIKKGVMPSQVKVFGFPVRSSFHQVEKEVNMSYSNENPLNVLIMSGGEGVGNMRKYAELLLQKYPCHVHIIAGRNKALKENLEETLVQQYADRVTVFGYVTNIHELMRKCDIAFTRGSPNVMMEAISCHLPLVITGSLPGQEADNPAFAEKYELAVSCKNPKKVEKIMDDLLANDAYKLKQMKIAQQQYSNPKTVDQIVEFILNMKPSDNVYTYIKPRKKLIR